MSCFAQTGLECLRCQLRRPLVSSSLVFAASMLVVVLFWAILPASARVEEGTEYDDFYKPVALSIAAGRGIVLPDGMPARRYPPGYPLMLAALFRVSDATHVPSQIVLSAFALVSMGLSAVLVLLLARSVWGPLPAFLAALAWSTYPLALWATKQPNTEIAFAVFLDAAFFLVWATLHSDRPAWPFCFLSGLLLGMAMLIRPIAIGTSLVMGCILWLSSLPLKSKLRLLLCLLSGTVLAVAPWEVSLYKQTNKVVFLGTNTAPALRDGLTFAVISKGYRQLTRVPPDVAALMQEVSRRGSWESIGELLALVTKQSRQRPGALAKLLAIKAERAWYATDSGRFEIPILLIQLLYLPLIVWSTRAAVRQGGTAKQLAAGVWLLTAYFWAMTVLALSIVRYMVPVMGLLFTLLPALWPNGQQGNERRVRGGSG